MDDEETILRDILVMTKSKMKMCSAPGCKNKRRRKGVCKKHAPKFLSEEPMPATRPLKCSECQAPVRCKGLCSFHYHKLWIDNKKTKKTKS